MVRGLRFDIVTRRPLSAQTQNVNVSGGLLHAYAWRPLATLTDEEVELLAAIRKRLSGPEDDAGDAITVESAPSNR